MHFVIFGLTVSSSWGNGHATLWRALLKALGRQHHSVTFYEKDVTYYATARDAWQHPPGFHLRLYNDLDEIRAEVRRDLDRADVSIVTSYCPDAQLASRFVLDSPARVHAFYDLDTPVTLSTLADGQPVPYLPPNGLGDFDLVLSYTGGKALNELQSHLGARVTVPLYGSVDPEAHAPAAPHPDFRADLSYLGTYAADRQPALEHLFLRPAARMPKQRFVLAGAQYPHDFPWTPNIFFLRHLEPALHPVLFSSSRATLNITRRAMAQYGYCPSGRLFEAAACGAPTLTDWWEGLDAFFNPGEEILRVDTADDVIAALERTDGELKSIGQRARERALCEHTADQRARTLIAYCNEVAAGSLPAACSA
jgi:spore maturation protein CgeB